MSQNQNKIKVGIQGASGYTGGELIRLILKYFPPFGPPSAIFLIIAIYRTHTADSRHHPSL